LGFWIIKTLEKLGLAWGGTAPSPERVKMKMEEQKELLLKTKA